MLVTGTVINKKNSEPIPFASVTLASSKGTYLNVGTAANSAGGFQLNSDLIASPNKLIFSSSGYQPIAFDAGLLTGEALRVELEETNDLDPVVITFHPKSNPIGWLLALVVLLIVGQKKL